MNKRSVKSNKIKTMFTVDVKSNIVDFVQKINVIKNNNNFFNDKQFISSKNITIGLEQFLDCINNGNYYAYEILINLNKKKFDNPKINNLVNVIFKICVYAINNSKLCDNMIYYINDNKNNDDNDSIHIQYTLWKLSYIVSGRNPLNIESNHIDYEIKNRDDLLQVKKHIIYTYDQYKKLNESKTNDDYIFLKNNLKAYIEENYGGKLKNENKKETKHHGNSDVNDSLADCMGKLVLSPTVDTYSFIDSQVVMLKEHIGSPLNQNIDTRVPS